MKLDMLFTVGMICGLIVASIRQLRSPTVSPVLVIQPWSDSTSGDVLWCHAIRRMAQRMEPRWEMYG